MRKRLLGLRSSMAWVRGLARGRKARTEPGRASASGLMASPVMTPESGYRLQPDWGGMRDAVFRLGDASPRRFRPKPQLGYRHGLRFGNSPNGPCM